MRIVIAGGHGKIALLLSALLSEKGHEVIGLIRNADHESDVRAAGAEPVVLDLESSDIPDVAAAVKGSDAVVFAAGAGPDSGAARKLTLDRDGAILLAEAAVAAGVSRVLVVSAIGADDHDPASDDVFQIYLRAKSEADAAIRAMDLDWTIVRPGGLTDAPPTGRVDLTKATGRVPRADVAAVLATSIDRNLAVRHQFDLVSGDDAIVDALEGLGAPE